MKDIYICVCVWGRIDVIVIEAVYTINKKTMITLNINRK